ncbi:hypothetical protein CTER_2837 [Ruminiclostridium cellobioparum subsp. termitidis CT1112]|uniref:Uncharacterized protein n=1 Tax=Ruminiclostridium cellobioparum subsp. termitidis CT1112 TaxID=1195236 RepID=S0FS21_RUMCE|nr:hypothetical protein CTER_2837 [Ruminiclostridium cellobioparum subsp. termitidis CT1112]
MIINTKNQALRVDFIPSRPIELIFQDICYDNYHSRHMLIFL